MTLKFGAKYICSLIVLAVAVTPVGAQGDQCSPVPVGTDGVFLQKASAACQASTFPRDDDMPAAIAASGQAPDGYVLVADLTRDTDGAELLVLVKPWSFQTDVLGLAMARLVRDGSVDGTTWHPVG